MQLKRFKHFIKEEFLYDPKILPGNLHVGDYYTVTDEDGKVYKGAVLKTFSGRVNVKAEVYAFEVEDYDGATDDRLYVLPEQVNKFIFHPATDLGVEIDDLVIGQDYDWYNEWANTGAGGMEEDATYIGTQIQIVDVTRYVFETDDHQIFVPYNELLDRVKEDLTIQNKTRRKYDLY